MIFVWVGLFGLVGVLSRYCLGKFALQKLSHPFPFTTFAINVSGAFFIGVIAGLGVHWSSPWVRAAIVIGFLGGFTTFSSYCLETLELFSNAHFRLGLCYFLLSPPLGLLAVYSGRFLGQHLRSI